jgi:hypothetical protein
MRTAGGRELSKVVGKVAFVEVAMALVDAFPPFPPPFPFDPVPVATGEVVL